MSELISSKTWNLIKMPAIITLIITVARFIAEMQHAPAWLASTAPGGGGALLGISWLIPVFAIYFAVKLKAGGEGPDSAGKSWGIWAASLAVMLLSVVPALLIKSIAGLVLTMVILAAATWVGTLGWKQLATTLLAYTLAARIPVIVAMAIATFGNMQSHYNGYPPPLDTVSPMAQFLLGGLLTQLTAWPAFTLVVGGLCGLAVASFVKTAGAQSAPPPAAKAAGA